MAAIRARDISDTPSEDVQEYTSTSRSRTASSRAPSATSSDWGHDFLSDHGSANGQERMTSESEERAGSTNSSGSKPRLEDRRPNSGATQINHRMNITADDVNRLPSATTVATSTMSTSFVKHPGPKHSVPNVGPRMIKPEEVVGIIPDRIGKMRYDRETMRWVKDRTSLDKADVLRENSGSGGRGSRSRSEESEDVFAGIDSWGRSPAPEVGGEDQELEHQDELSSSSEEDEGAIQQADITHIFDEGGSFTETDVSGDDIHPTGQIRPNSKDASPPPRPAPLHANSAPAVMTPRPNSKLSPPKPIRSALRNPMTSVNPSLTPGIKKQTQWHESVTPAPGSSRRSVSFSDGKKNGKIRELHPDESINTIESDLTGRMDGMKLDHVATTFTGDEEFFRGQPDKSWMPSARTKRVQHALGDMENLSKSPFWKPRTSADPQVLIMEHLPSRVAQPWNHLLILQWTCRIAIEMTKFLAKETLTERSCLHPLNSNQSDLETDRPDETMETLHSSPNAALAFRMINWFKSSLTSTVPSRIGSISLSWICAKRRWKALQG